MITDDSLDNLQVRGFPFRGGFRYRSTHPALTSLTHAHATLAKHNAERCRKAFPNRVWEREKLIHLTEECYYVFQEN